MINTIIFDWGGVLIDNPAQGLLDYCASHLNVNSAVLETVLDAYLPHFQKGTLPEQELWEKVTKDLDVAPPRVDSLWEDAFRSVYIPKEEMFDLAKRLKENGYKVGFLSNTEVPPMNYFHERGYGDIFQEPVFSCAVGAIKPEAEIYQITAKRLGIDPKTAVFIDDKISYIEGARAVGMSGIVFDNPQQVKKELANLGININ
jgi:putative hydrolase of the HAD superfamily